MFFPRCPCCGALVTIRKFSDVDGSEVWHGVRGLRSSPVTPPADFMYFNLLPAACQSIYLREDLIDDYYGDGEIYIDTAGHPVRAADDGVIIRWKDHGTFVTIDRYSQSLSSRYDASMGWTASAAQATLFDAETHETQFAPRHLGKYWTAGTLARDDGTLRKAVQVYDDVTLEADWIVELPLHQDRSDTLGQPFGVPLFYQAGDGTDDASELVGVYPTTGGVFVIRDGWIPYWDRVVDPDATWVAPGTIIDKIDETGSIVASTSFFPGRPYGWVSSGGVPLPGVPGWIGRDLRTSFTQLVGAYDGAIYLFLSQTGQGNKTPFQFGKWDSDLTFTLLSEVSPYSESTVHPLCGSTNDGIGIGLRSDVSGFSNLQAEYEGRVFGGNLYAQFTQLDDGEYYDGLLTPVEHPSQASVFRLPIAGGPGEWLDPSELHATFDDNLSSTFRQVTHQDRSVSGIELVNGPSLVKLSGASIVWESGTLNQVYAGNHPTFGNPLYVTWLSTEYSFIHSTANAHYLVGRARSYYPEPTDPPVHRGFAAGKLSSSTGQFSWGGQHNAAEGVLVADIDANAENVPLLDAVYYADHLYVCGQGSSYAP